jgi:hypothetical protein
LKDAKRKLDSKTRLSIYFRPSTISIDVKLWDYKRNKLFKTNKVLFNNNSFGIEEIQVKFKGKKLFEYYLTLKVKTIKLTNIDKSSNEKNILRLNLNTFQLLLIVAPI